MNTKNNRKNTHLKTVPQSTKKPTIDKQKLLAYILAGLMIFWTLASIFGFIAYGRTTKRADNGVISASAQTVSDISTSDSLKFELPYLTGLTLYDGHNRTTTYSGAYLQLSSNALILNTSQFFVFGSTATTLTFPRTYTYLQSVGAGVGYQFLSSSGPQSLTIRQYGDYDIAFGDLYQINAVFIDYEFFYDGSINALVVNITLRVDYVGMLYSYSFDICYPYEYDVTLPANNPTYYIPFTGTSSAYNRTRVITDTLGYGVPTAEFLKYYNLTSTLSPDAVLTYEMAYDKGYQSGLTEGAKQATGSAYAEGRQDGYAEGKRDGYAEGEAVGYANGANDANLYTFDNLLSAVFDVPVRTFSSLFNFELLGFNLLDFFLALMSAGLILAIIRLIL